MKSKRSSSNRWSQVAQGRKNKRSNDWNPTWLALSSVSHSDFRRPMEYGGSSNSSYFNHGTFEPSSPTLPPLNVNLDSQSGQTTASGPYQGYLSYLSPATTTNYGYGSGPSSAYGFRNFGSPASQSTATPFSACSYRTAADPLQAFLNPSKTQQTFS